MRWSVDVAAADWIGPRLDPFGSGWVTSVVPGGFDRYARILHPVSSVEYGDESTVRWSDVAGWSGTTVERDTQFLEIALPERDPGTPPPWQSQGPFEGSLTGGDAARLAAIARKHTATPHECWFCVWDGYGWDRVAAYLSFGEADDVPPELPFEPDPVPPEVRDGPRVRLPDRDYLLYTGPVEDALAFVESQRQTPNLFWPADRAWCVASEIDLTCTYIGGSAELIDAVLADPGIEALPAEPGDTMQDRVPGWLVDAVEGCVRELLETGACVLETACGSLHAQLVRAGRIRRGHLSVEYRWHGQTTGRHGSQIGARTDSELGAELRRMLSGSVRGLVMA